MSALKLILILFFTTMIHFAYGQSEDRIKVSKNDHRVLIKTTVLHGSESNMSAAMSYGLRLLDITSSECKESNSEHLPPTQINSIKLGKDSLLTIDIQLNANCSHYFLGEIDVVQDSILTLIYHGYGGYAMCNCCYGLTYTIQPMEFQNFNPEKVKQVMIQNWKSTMKTIPWNKK